MMIRRLRLVALALAATLALAACGGSENQTIDSAEPATTPAADPTPSEPTEPTEEPAQEPEAASISAEDLRITLEQQLGAHAVLAIAAMRQGVQGAPEFEAAAAALNKNTDDLTESIRLVYGDEGAEAFRTMWSDHIGFFVTYTQGLAADDQQKKDEALARLEQYRQDFSTFLGQASEGNIDPAAVAEGLQMHVDQLVSQIDAYHAGDFEQAYTIEREAHRHMFATAQALAGGISEQFPDRFATAGMTATAVSSPHVAQAEGEGPGSALELRSALGMLLGEHAQLAIVAMRRGVTGAEDFDAAAGSLSQNTAALTDAIRSVYGDEGAAAFEQMWSDHIGFFVAYTQGLAADDQQKKDEALARLEQYRQDFSTFLGQASEGNIEPSAAAGALQMHVDQLVSQIDAYHAGDFEQAYTVGYDAYLHMFETAAALAGGIAQQMPEQFPGSTGGSATHS